MGARLNASYLVLIGLLLNAILLSMRRDFGQYVKTKKKYKDAGSSTDRVRVYCRLRPTDGGNTPSHTDAPSTFITPDDIGSSQSCIDSFDKKGGFVYRKVSGELKQYQYDGFFAPDATQADVYRQVGSDVVNGVMEGYNGTIFAYGQTGSGKTHTMMGPADGRDFGASGGVIPRAFAQVFETVQNTAGAYTYQLSVSFVQIYCELLTDLLRTESDITGVRESSVPGEGVHVEGLSSFNVNSPEEVLALLEQGNENREVASTKMNAHSSRSHAVFILHVQRRNRNDTPPDYSSDQQQQQVQHSKLVLVDLAGSERAKRTIDSSAGGRYLQFTELKVRYCASLCAFSWW